MSCSDADVSGWRASFHCTTAAVTTMERPIAIFRFMTSSFQEPGKQALIRPCESSSVRGLPRVQARSSSVERTVHFAEGTIPEGGTMFLKKLIAVTFPLVIAGAALANPPPPSGPETGEKATKLSESLSVLQAVGQWATKL